MKQFIAAVLWLALASAALAQSTPNLITGQVPTAAQWNSYFAGKQDYQGYRTVNKGGDVMLGLLRFSMGAPSVSACGSSPSVVGNNQAGTVTTGTGTPTSCTLTFNTTNPFSGVPSCVVTWRANLATMTYSPSQTAVVMTQTATSGAKIDYHCVGLQ